MDIFVIYRVGARVFRRKRMKRFATILDIKDTDRIIDVGGYPEIWKLIDVKPHVLMVNLEEENWEDGRFKKIEGDGRALKFPDRFFDIAFSNSVIEHVGNYDDQLSFAREIARVARRYYVQTPYRWFFVEPHLVAPFISYLPRPILRKLVRYFSVWGLLNKPRQDQVDEFLDGIRLLNCTQLQSLFPDAKLYKEKFLGLTKSIIAIRA